MVLQPPLRSATSSTSFVDGEAGRCAEVVVVDSSVDFLCAAGTSVSEMGIGLSRPDIFVSESMSEEERVNQRYIVCGKIGLAQTRPREKSTLDAHTKENRVFVWRPRAMRFVIRYIALYSKLAPTQNRVEMAVVSLHANAINVCLNLL